jgi:putative inorganic carbon (HCO3(-)) transporter
LPHHRRLAGRSFGLSVVVRPAWEALGLVALTARAVGHVPVIAEWLPLVLAAPLLMFPGSYTPIAIGLLGVALVLRRLALGRWLPASTANGPMLVLLCALLVSLFASIHLGYSAPKAWGILLGVAVFYAVVSTCRSNRTFGLASFAILGIGAFIAAIGIAGMTEPGEKLFFGRDLYAALPRAVADVQTSTIVTRGFNPNEVGGMLALFAPIAVSLAFSRRRIALLAAPSALFLLICLVLTQSRSSIAGVAIALIVGAVWLLRDLRPALLGGLIAGGAGLFAVIGPQRLSQLVFNENSGEPVLTLAGRLEMWQRALTMLLDMPITGIGLNTFPLILLDFYPSAHYREVYSVPHAHNLFLQTGLDFGIAGLLAFLLILAVAVRGGIAAVRHGADRPLAVGLLLGVLAHSLYSMTDAVALGAKPGPALWATLGLLCALGASATRAVAPLRESTPVEAALPQPRQASGNAATETGQLRAWRRYASWGAAGIVVALLIPAATIDGVRLFLHHPERQAAASHPVLGAGLDVAHAIAWGPYASRVLATQALVARSRNDVEGEMVALAAAVQAGPWDDTARYRLGELRLAAGDIPGAVEAWGTNKVVERMIDRGKDVPPATTLVWLAQVQSADPGDWRPHAAAAQVLTRSNRPDQAAAALADALWLRERGGVVDSLAERLIDPAAPLPDTASATPSATDGELFALASDLLKTRADLRGALFAAQLAVEADRRHAAHWTRVADLWALLDRPILATEARQRAASLRR